MKRAAALNVEIKLWRVALFLILVACLQPVGLAHADQTEFDMDRDEMAVPNGSVGRG